MSFAGNSGLCCFSRLAEERCRRSRGGSEFCPLRTVRSPPPAQQRGSGWVGPELSSSRVTVSSCHPQVSICLECNSSKLRGLKRKWIRCSAQATVLHLKKFIAKKLNLTSFNEVRRRRRRLASHTLGRVAAPSAEEETGGGDCCCGGRRSTSTSTSAPSPGCSL